MALSCTSFAILNKRGEFLLYGRDQDDIQEERAMQLGCRLTEQYPWQRIQTAPSPTAVKLPCSLCPASFAQETETLSELEAMTRRETLAGLSRQEIEYELDLLLSME